MAGNLRATIPAVLVAGSAESSTLVELESSDQLVLVTGADIPLSHLLLPSVLIPSSHTTLLDPYGLSVVDHSDLTHIPLFDPVLLDAVVVLSVLVLVDLVLLDVDQFELPLDDDSPPSHELDPPPHPQKLFVGVVAHVGPLPLP